MSENGGSSGCAAIVAMLLSSLFGFFGFMGVAQQSAFSDLSTTPPAPTVEIVLAPADADSTAPQLDAVEAVLQARLLALARAGQIADGYFSMARGVSNQLTIGLIEGTLAADEVAAALIQPGYLEFVDFSSVDSGAVMQYVGQAIVTTASVARGAADAGPEVFPTVITHNDILRAEATGTGNSDDPWPGVLVDLTPDAGARMGDFTETHIGAGMAIVLDGVVLSVPIIQARLETSILISGNFTESEVLILAAQISSQPLPVALQVVSINTITTP